jgi:prolyl-tRNA synthetase
MTKIMDIIRDEMDRIDGQELLMPVFNPASLWIETGRYNAMGPELVRFKDRRGTDMCLAMTNEETVTDLARGYISSYRDLPFMLYHIQTKVRDEARPRGGLIRVREFLMKDAYSFHRDAIDLARYYEDIYEAYRRSFIRMGIPSIPVEADSGAMGGSASHEFILPTDSGEDTFARCDACGLSANVERAEVVSKEVTPDGEYPPKEDVHTPNVMTIEDLTKFFDIDESQFLKAVAYEADGKIVIAFINGAYEVNETKLKNRLNAIDLDVADPRVLSDAGIVPGYISPGGAQKAKATIVFDKTVLSQPVYVVGGDREDYHSKNAVVGRDVMVTETHDIATVREGDPCPGCGKGTIKLQRGVELGHTFQLGTRYSESMGLTYLTEEGKEELVVMGCYGIGVERAMASVIEAHHDDLGIIWPVSVAPFDAVVLPLGSEDEIMKKAVALSEELGAELDVLIDDRAETAGVKFADADLLGIPIRIVVSKKLVSAGEVELKARRTGEVAVVPESQAMEKTMSLLQQLAKQEGVMLDET